MTQALSRIAQATGYDQNQVQLVKDTIARGASDDELMLFLHLAQRSGLDPFSRQIYLIERRAQVNGEWKTSRQPQTAIDGLRLIADRTDRYAPGREPEFAYNADGHLIKATAYVKKWVRGEWHEIAASAHYDEYVQRTGKGEVTKMWNEKPHIMLAKCAEALAIRRAFPAELSGLYTADETGQQESAEAPHVTVTQPSVRALPPAPRADLTTGEVIEEAGASYEPPPQPTPANGKPKDADEAQQRFYARYAETIGGESWSAVQRYLKSRAPRPNTVEGWIAAAEAVRARARDDLQLYVFELTARADELNLEVITAKPVEDMTGAELNAHRANLEAAIAEAEAPAADDVPAGMEEVDLPAITDAERAALVV